MLIIEDCKFPKKIILNNSIVLFVSSVSGESDRVREREIKISKGMFYRSNQLKKDKNKEINRRTLNFVYFCASVLKIIFV